MSRRSVEVTTDLVLRAYRHGLFPMAEGRAGDKLFGTFQPEDERYQPLRYGLTKDLENPGPVNIIFHEWKAIGRDLLTRGLSWKQKMQYLFGPPGWSHDGSRQTSKELRTIEAEDAAVR